MTKGIAKEIKLPGSKSITQRALVVAALAEGRSTLRGALIAEDTQLLIEALLMLGVEITVDGTKITVTGKDGNFAANNQKIFLGNNGTALRFLLSLVSFGKGTYALDGGARLRERPVAALVKVLRGLGVSIESTNQNGYLPLLVKATGIGGGDATFTDIDSSQYVSSLMLVSAYAREDVRIFLEGKRVSEPYIEMTIRVMEDFGVSVTRKGEGIFSIASGQRYTAREYLVEADATSASYFFALAMLTQGRVHIPNLSRSSIQGDIGFLGVLSLLGAEVCETDGGVVVIGRPLREGDLSFDIGAMPDVVPTLAVLCAFRKGRTTIKNVAHLRVKESNRIAALVRELGKIGAIAQERADGLVVEGGGALHGAEIETYNDHRIAMSFAIAGRLISGIEVADKNCVNKSFPDFWKMLDSV